MNVTPTRHRFAARRACPVELVVLAIGRSQYDLPWNQDRILFHTSEDEEVCVTYSKFDESYRFYLSAVYCEGSIVTSVTTVTTSVTTTERSFDHRVANADLHAHSSEVPIAVEGTVHIVYPVLLERVLN